MLELSAIRSEQIIQRVQEISSRVIAESTGTHRCAFRVGGISVQLHGTRDTDMTMDSTLLPFCVAPGAADISIQVERVPTLSPTHGRQLFDSGSVWRLYESEGDFQFDFKSSAVSVAPYKRLLVDDQFRRASLLLNDQCFKEDRADPLEYPLDELLVMHRLTQEQAIELHGVGIVAPDGTSNLFIGHSGAGKSTTARLWTSLHKVEILSDDRIIVRAETIAGNNALTPSTQVFMYGTPWHGEAHFALPQRAPLHRIFVLEHGLGNVITQLSPSQAVSELFARSFVPFHRHQYVDHALSFLERVAYTIPCYRYSFEPDERAVEKIFQFND